MGLSSKINKSDIVKCYVSGLTLREIGEKYNCSSSNILHYMKKYGIKRRPQSSVPRALPYNLDFNSYAFQYIAGALYGDGCIAKRSLILSVKDMDFRDFFVKQSLSLGLNIKAYPINNDGMFSGIIYSKLFVEVMNRYNKTPVIDCAFVNGFADAEGSVENSMMKSVRLFNGNEQLLNYICDFLESLDIHSYILEHKEKKPYNTTYALVITRKENLVKFHSHFHFSIKRKQDRLDAIVKSYEVIS